MRRLLASIGIESTVEIETTEYDVPESGGPRVTYVRAHLVIEDQRAGVTWSATLTGAGTQSFYGPLAPVVSLGSYDVVSENEAVERLSDPRFAGFYGPFIAYAEPEPAVLQDGAASGLQERADESATESMLAPERARDRTVPPTPEPGERIAWPVTEVTITEARLGIAQQSLPSGATVLLPAYELSGGDGGTWSVLAVANSDLDFAEIEAE